jgi:hypothetical protein
MAYTNKNDTQAVPEPSRSPVLTVTLQTVTPKDFSRTSARVRSGSGTAFAIDVVSLVKKMPSMIEEEQAAAQSSSTTAYNSNEDEHARLLQRKSMSEARRQTVERISMVRHDSSHIIHRNIV